MEINPNLYKNKTNHKKVRAIQVNERNYIAVANWAAENGRKAEALAKVSPSGDVSNHRVRVGKLIAKVGDWVVKAEGEDTAFRVKDDVFDAQYKAIL